MNPEETRKAVKVLATNWSQPTQGPSFDERCVVWHRYLQDLNLSDVIAAIDRIIVTDQPWMPRVGQVRRGVIDRSVEDPAPPPAEAWQQLRTSIEAVESGLAPPKVHEVVASTMKKFGGMVTALRTNNDRELFLKTYEVDRQEWEHQLYELGHDNT